MRALQVLVMVVAALLAVGYADDDMSVLDGTASSVTSESGDSGSSAAATTVPTETTSAPTATTSAPIATTTTPTVTTTAPSKTTSAPTSTTKTPTATTSAPTTTSPASSSASSSSSSASTQGTVAPADDSTSSSNASVSVLDTNTGVSSASGATTNTVGIVLGCLACVGAIVLVVTYKKSNGSEEQHTPPSSCAYADGNGFTPDSRSLDAILEGERPTSHAQDDRDRRSIVPVLSMADLSTSAATAATRASSPFAINSKAMRVSSPVQLNSSCSSDDMVFATSSRRKAEDVEVVISMQALERESSASAVAAIEHGNGQVML